MGNDAFSDLKDQYNYSVTAYALLFSTSNAIYEENFKALRVEAPDIGKEFSDNVYIGRDPEGLLYFNDLNTFSQPNQPLQNSDPITYLVQKLNNPSDGKLLVKITFTRKDADEPHAVFLAEDPLGTVDGAGMDNYTNDRPGYWAPLTLGSVNATISKDSDKKQITITISTIHKSVTIANPDNLLRGKGFDVDGMMHFKDINSLGSGVYANWNDDRVVFYSDQYTAKDFVGFFIPYEYSVDSLEYKPTNVPTALIFSVQWA